MNTKIITSIVLLSGLIALGGLLSLPKENKIAGNSASQLGGKMVLHKSSTCGCCGVYGSYMKKLGYDVETHNTDDLESVKTDLGIPYELASCHTSEIGGYVVEGHIPEEIIAKLLEEKPNIKGIGMAGMPSGSPGMPGPKTEDFVIYEITHEGIEGSIFATL